MLSNEKAMGAARATVAAARSVSRRGQTVAAGDYDSVFFVAGEMRSGTSWLRHSLSDHPEIACGQEGSFFGRGYDHEEIPVYTGPVSSLTRALALSRELEDLARTALEPVVGRLRRGLEESLSPLVSTTSSPRRWPARDAG